MYETQSLFEAKTEAILFAMKNMLLQLWTSVNAFHTWIMLYAVNHLIWLIVVHDSLHIQQKKPTFSICKVQ